MSKCSKCGVEGVFYNFGGNTNFLCTKCCNSTIKDKQDNILRPSWYKGSNGIEVVQIIDGFNLDFFTGAAIKYICRAGKKDKQKEIEDYKKAIAFLEMKIERVGK